MVVGRGGSAGAVGRGGGALALSLAVDAPPLRAVCSSTAGCKLFVFICSRGGRINRKA